MAKKEWKQRLIPKKALFRASLIWETWVQTCYNYERMMGMMSKAVSFKVALPCGFVSPVSKSRF